MRTILVAVAVALAMAAPAAAHHGGENTTAPAGPQTVCDWDGIEGFVSTEGYCVTPHPEPPTPVPATACEADGESGFVTLDGSCMTPSAYDRTFATEAVPEPRQQEVAANPSVEEGPTVDEVLAFYWHPMVAL